VQVVSGSIPSTADLGGTVQAVGTGTALFGGCTVQVFTVQPMSTPSLMRTGAAMAVAETRTSVRRESFIVVVLRECV